MIDPELAILYANTKKAEVSLISSLFCFKEPHESQLVFLSLNLQNTYSLNPRTLVGVPGISQIVTAISFLG